MRQQNTQQYGFRKLQLKGRSIRPLFLCYLRFNQRADAAYCPVLPPIKTKINYRFLHYFCNQLQRLISATTLLKQVH